MLTACISQRGRILLVQSVELLTSAVHRVGTLLGVYQAGARLQKTLMMNSFARVMLLTVEMRESVSSRCRLCFVTSFYNSKRLHFLSRDWTCMHICTCCNEAHSYVCMAVWILNKEPKNMSTDLKYYWCMKYLMEEVGLTFITYGKKMKQILI